MNWFLYVIYFAGPLTLVAVMIAPLRRFLRQRSILDHPNNRSSHIIPTPKGGGLVVVPVVVLTWFFCAWMDGNRDHMVELLTVGGLAALLCLLSWLDDLRGLPASLRLVSHAAMTTAIVLLMPSDALVFQGVLPTPVDRVLTILAWVWFINLFNFMDGIDGISGVQLLGMGAGVIALGAVTPLADQLVSFAVVLAGAACGFLLWNWHPAKIFLGDAGSAPLGFLAGWVLIRLAIAGEWEAALILPAYYSADGTITLVRRLLRGERVWYAHREHFYQRAVQSGCSHSTVSLAVLASAAALAVGAVLCATDRPLGGTLVSVITIICIFVFFQAGCRKNG